MFAVDVCNLPVTGGSTFVVVAGLFLLVAGVILAHWVRQSAGRMSVVAAPLVLLGGLALVPLTADSCLNPATAAPLLSVVEGLPASSTPLLSNDAVAIGGAVTVTVGGFVPNEVVQLIVASTPQVIGFASANSQGVVTLVGNLPEGLSAGDHTLAVYAPVSGIGFAQQITVESLDISTTVAPTTTIAPTTTVAPTTTIALTCATGGTCAAGNTGPGGGIVFYDAGSIQSWGRYLEVACAGWLNNCDGSADPEASWGCYRTAIVGADGYLIGAGKQNTADIVNGACTDTGIAAKLADAYSNTGQSDWFLPSQDELNALCKWAFNDSVNAICNDNGGGSYSLSMHGGFSTGYYWSSSEVGAFYSWMQDFGSGLEISARGVNAGSVRPVRAF